MGALRCEKSGAVLNNMFYLRIVHKEEAALNAPPPEIPGLQVEQVSASGYHVLLAADRYETHVLRTGNYLGVVGSLESPKISEKELADLTPENYEALLGDDVFFVALVDVVTGKIFLARNISAVRNVYYVPTESSFSCASSLALLHHLGIPFEPNESVLPEFYAYRTLLAPNTLAKGVRRLAAGELTTLTCFEPSSVARHHHTFTFADSSVAPNLEEVSKQVRSILADAVSIPFASNGSSLATLLSGGLDSTLLALLACEKDKELVSYSSDFSFLNTSDMEAEYALSVAEHLHIRHTVCTTDEIEYLNALVDSIAVAGEPLHHLQSVLLYILFHRCHDSSRRVFLCGEGADGFFGNTLHEKLYRFKRLTRLLQRNGSGALVQAAARLMNRIDPRFEFLTYDYRHEDTSDYHILWTLGLFGDIDFITRFFSCSRRDIFASRQELMASYLDYDIMDKVTILSLLGGMSTTMPLWAHLADSAGLSLVYPYTTPRLMTYINAVPWSVKGKEAKAVIKHILRTRGVPEHIISRPKLSFGFPTRYWALPGTFFQPLVDMAATMFEAPVLRSLQQEEVSKAMILWNMINYFLWHALFVEGTAAEDIKREINERYRTLSREH